MADMHASVAMPMSVAELTTNAISEVAYLRFRHSERAKDARYAIFANDEFDVGRRHMQDLFKETDMTISNHHLRFWCVMYESDSEEQVSPMVYVQVLSANKVPFAPAMGAGHITSHALIKTDPAALLNHGDVLHLTAKISIRFEADRNHRVQARNLTDEQVAELEHFDNQYHITDRRLGIGAYGSVFVAVKLSNRRQLACKIIGPSIEHQKRAERIQDSFYTLPAGHETTAKDSRDRSREYTVLKNLSHPNIITLEKVICATKHTYIFQELITGGDLLSHLDKNGPLSEAESAVIARQIVMAVNYLHDNGVVHRDIKPENILMTSLREGARIVLTDFGQARTFEEAQAEVRSSAVSRMHSMVGTYGYTAPEVLVMEQQELRKRGYSKAVDVWSIGCTTATLLTNQPMFPDEAKGAKARALLHERRASQRWSTTAMDEGEEWKAVGRKAKSFIRSCLRLDETNRLTAKQALQHEWFTNKHYAKDIEDAYQRAIEDWTPRDPVENIIEIIDTSATARQADSVPMNMDTQITQVKSQYFPQLPPNSLQPPPSLFYNNFAYPTQPSLQLETIPLRPVETKALQQVELESDALPTDEAGDSTHVVTSPHPQMFYLTSDCVENSTTWYDTSPPSRVKQNP